MVSHHKNNNPGTSYRLCADTYCQRPFFVTEDVRQKYCNKTCSKRVKNRKRQANADNLLEFLYPTKKTVKEIIMFNESHSSPTPQPAPEHTALRYLRENLAWSKRQLDDGLKEIDRQMAELGRQIKANTETLKKINEQREAIAILERNL